MTREDVECIVRTSMFTSHSQQFLDHDAEQRQQIEQQAAEIARLREALAGLENVLDDADSLDDVRMWFCNQQMKDGGQ